MKHEISDSRRPKLKLPLFPLLFSVGAIGYYSLEILYRGYSHWTMAICGGLSVWLIYHANRRLAHRSLLLRALTGAIIITAIELMAGCIVNLLLGWQVWDYSSLPLNLWGQITPVFSALWFLLCLPVCAVCSLADGLALRHRMK